MDLQNSEGKKQERSLEGFSANDPTRIFWNSRKRSVLGHSMCTLKASGRLVVDKTTEDTPEKLEKQREGSPMNMENPHDASTAPVLSERRKALFEPLEPHTDIINVRRSSADMLLPPPDFDTTSYPKGWLIGKKRKLVNIDVVESMRRIAVQEMNRKDREIDGLNEQLEEDARAVEHLQVQLLEERRKRANIECENRMLQSQISMLMNMMQETEDGAEAEGTEDS